MNLKWKTWQVSIFIKLVLIFLVVIIPLYSVSLVINEWGSNSIRHEISKSILSKVHFYLNSLETEVLHIRNRQFEYLKDDNLQSLSVASEKMTDYEKVKAINELQKKLQVMKDSSIYIKNVSVHIPSMDKTISTRRSFGEIPEDEFKALMELPRESGSPVIYWENKIFLSTSYPDRPFTGIKNPMFVIGTELSREKLSRALSQFTDYKGSGLVLINKSQDWFISINSDAGMLSNIKSFLQSQSDKKTVDNMERIKIDKQNYLVLYNISSYLGMTLLAYVPEEQVMGRLKIYQIWFWVLSIISIAIIVFFSYSIYRLIHRPLLDLVRSYRKVDEGELNITIIHKSNDEFRFLYEHFNIMVEKLKGLIHQVYEEKILAQRAELKQLQSQINPHFLFNSFYLLNRMIKAEDNENAKLFSQHLGKYFEFITRNATDEIQLSMEVKHARAYVEIQTMRYSNHVQVEFDNLPAECENIQVPRLILQPIIENAYEYGMNKRVKDGMISIKMKVSGDRLCISVEDNGEGLDDCMLDDLKNKLSEKDNGNENTGIINVHRRIQLKFGSGSGLTVSRGQSGGLKVDIDIPLTREE